MKRQTVDCLFGELLFAGLGAPAADAQVVYPGAACPTAFQPAPFQPAPLPAQAAHVRVQLPASYANLWINGFAMPATGRMDRMFRVPADRPATYDIAASWMQNGRLVTARRQVQLRPGEQATVDLAAGAPQPQLAQGGPMPRRVLRPAAPGAEGGGPPAEQAGEQSFRVLPGRLSKEELQELAPGLGYLKARNTLQQPQQRLGGALKVRVTSAGGDTRVILPGTRKLDMRVFGIPGLPRSWGGTPGINGVPLDMRKVSGQGDRYTETAKEVPASNNWVAAHEGSFTLEATDITSTDAAVTNDSVKFEASWKDDAGNTYTVRCNKMVPHGVEYPVFGGVVTNHILHGFTRLGTALMPTEFAYVAFWGEGETLKNGEVMEKPIMVHGMLTELVRTEDYELAHDEEVNPTGRHFHLMVPPFMPKKGKMEFEHHPVNTGFKTKQGKELPFWHVMFEDPHVETLPTEGPAEAQQQPPQPQAGR